MKRVLFIGWVLLFLASCAPDEDPFFGCWTVDKVNVDFDAEGATPEMVRQLGTMEKNNVVIITADSVLTLVSDGDTIRYRCSLCGNQILCNGVRWGCFENGILKTETSTPIGSVKVSYKKSNQ